MENERQNKKVPDNTIEKRLKHVIISTRKNNTIKFKLCNIYIKGKTTFVKFVPELDEIYESSIRV